MYVQDNMQYVTMSPCTQEWGAFSADLATFTIKDGQRSIAWCSTKRPSRLSAKCIERMQQ